MRKPSYVIWEGEGDALHVDPQTDARRTFPHHEFFHDGQGIGQENLFNVLKAYSLCFNRLLTIFCKCADIWPKI